MCQYWMQLSRIHVLRKCCHKQISFLFVKRCQIVSFYTRSRRKLGCVYRCHFVCIQTCKIDNMYSAHRHLQVFTFGTTNWGNKGLRPWFFPKHGLSSMQLIACFSKFKIFGCCFNGGIGGRFTTKRLNYYYKSCFMLKCPQYLLSDLKSDNIFRCFSEIF